MRAHRRRVSRKLTLREPCARKLTIDQPVTFCPVTTIAAIPPPSAYVRSSAPSGPPKLRQMLQSDVIAVRPIQPIPDEERRLRDPRVNDGQPPSEDTVRRGGGPSGEEVRSRPLGTPEGTAAGTGLSRSDGGFRPEPSPPPPAPPQQQAAASPTTGFLTQSIAQEAIGNGLHIEPWAAALGAYRRAAASPRESLVSNVSV
jgi:hypothetical protein